MEEEKTYKIVLSFVLDVPDEISQCDFYSLVLRMRRLEDEMDKAMGEFEMESYNRNIEEMQQLLENFKIRRIY